MAGVASAIYRILLVDDHDIVRRTIKKIIQRRTEWEVFEAAHGKEAVEKYFDLKPDLVLMDFSIPVLNGLAAAKQILYFDSSANILMISVIDSPHFVGEVKKIGIKGFCSKAEIGRLHEAVDAILSGETYFA
jgi:DNA-binding NarL/FixJ family response regulator